MGRPSRRVQVRGFRGHIRSPGAPTDIRREDRVRFWAAIGAGAKTREAAVAAGVSEPVGHRWFRHAGGVNPCMPWSVSGRYLSFDERERIALLRAGGHGVREIARRIGRSASTVSRELRRGASTRTYHLEYKATVAHWHAGRRARRPKSGKLAANPRLRAYVQDRLDGAICDARGRVVGLLEAEFNGKAKPHRGDRRWVAAWSPEQISAGLRRDFPDDASMRISPEAIYQALYTGRRGLDRSLSRCLRKGRTTRVPRERARAVAWAHVTEPTLLKHRPAAVDDRLQAGHWEGDLILGTSRSAIGTLVERTTRYVKLVHLPREKGYGKIRPVKNGPALAGYGAKTMTRALTAMIKCMPAQAWRTLTWDRGKELSDHAALTKETGVAVYFADPRSPWQRGSNENTNGLLRQYFPKGTDLARWSAAELEAVEHAINNRPRKCLNWNTPAQALQNQLRSVQTDAVATTS